MMTGSKVIERGGFDVIPVVIIGAGPVGMVMALDLARYGIATVLVEKETGARNSPKGNTHNARTMEHYRRLALAEDIRKLGLPADQQTDVIAQTRLDGFELGRIHLSSWNDKSSLRDQKTATDQYPEPMHRANQMYVERYMLEQVLASDRISTLLGWEYVCSSQCDEHVDVRLRSSDGREERNVRCAYLIGCDGGRSAVRHDLGVKFEGEDSFDKGFMGGPMRASHLRISRFYDAFERSRGWQYFIINNRFMGTIIDLNGSDEFQLHSAMEQTPTETDVVELVMSFAKMPLEVELLSSRTWAAGRALVAEKYGHGRTWLVGDSAHVFTPTGGLGMNTGIDDAANLAWKLAAVLQGWGSANLVDTYEVERRPIGIRNTSWARGNALRLRSIARPPELEDTTEEGERARETVTSVFQSIKDEFGADGIQLGARYSASPIVAPDPEIETSDDDPNRYLPSAMPGGRAPHFWLEDGRSLYDLIAHGFLLVRFAETSDADVFLGRALARGLPVQLADVRLPDAARLYSSKMALIRPDHIIAWRGDNLQEPDLLLDVVGGWRMQGEASACRAGSVTGSFEKQRQA